tara:strand:+ start:831 stop:1355 length:525 start_codon:yes stop_codon:yes gene_type:complete
MVNLSYIKKYLKKVLSKLDAVYIFESKRNLNFKNKKNTKYLATTSINEIKKKKYLLNFFKNNKSKIQRFKNKSKFHFLLKNQLIICSGWSFSGNTWYIEEIDRKIDFKNKIILYDFYTHKKFRNRGYYQYLLKKINKSNKKNNIIYSRSNNAASIKAITSAGFTLLHKLKNRDK